jgi:hypothetical protein
MSDHPNRAAAAQYAADYERTRDLAASDWGNGRSVERTGPIVSQSTIDAVRRLEESDQREYQEKQVRDRERKLTAALTTARFHIDNELPVPWQAVQIILSEITDDEGRDY